MPNRSNPSSTRFTSAPASGGRPLFLCFVLGILSTGCGSTTADRVQVSGRVTYSGKPVPAGRIEFIPNYNHSAAGPGGFALIKDGAFNTKVDGRGLSPGSYLARIEGFDNQVSPIGEVFHGNPLFPKYETEIVINQEQAEILFEVPEKNSR